MTIEMSSEELSKVKIPESSGETILALDYETFLRDASRRFSPDKEAAIAESPEEIASHYRPQEPIKAVIKGKDIDFEVEIDPDKKVPENFRELQLQEGMEFLARAAASAEAAKNETQDPEKKPALEGLSENLVGAIGWVAGKTGAHKGKVLNTLGAGVFAATVAACGGDIETKVPQPTDTSETQPRVTAVAPEASSTQKPTETPAPPKNPEAFESNQDLLGKRGYSIEETETAWQVVFGEEGSLVARSEDGENIQIQTKEGEELSFPQEAFLPRELNGARDFLATIQEKDKDTPSYFFLEGEGWVTPIEIQRDPENIENYTQITPEDIWSGRVLMSEILEAEDEPFPEGTVVPDAYYYRTIEFPAGYTVLLDDWIDRQGRDYWDIVKYGNDFRRWFGFYRLTAEDGRKMVIGTERWLYTDGEASLFLHFAFGEEWYWDKKENNYNVVDRFFAGKTNTRRTGMVLPLIYYDGPHSCEKLHTSTGEPITACMYYELPQNDPVSIRPEIQTLIEDWKTGGIENNGAGAEIFLLQRMLLVPETYGEYPLEYFENSK
jgi:hypothetical protein